MEDFLFGIKQYGISVLYTALYFLGIQLIRDGQALIESSSLSTILAVIVYIVFWFIWEKSFYRQVTRFYQCDFQFVLASSSSGSYGWLQSQKMMVFSQKYFYRLWLVLPIVAGLLYVTEKLPFEIDWSQDTFIAMLFWAAYVCGFLFQYALIRINVLTPNKPVLKKKYTKKSNKKKKKR